MPLDNVEHTTMNNCILHSNILFLTHFPTYMCLAHSNNNNNSNCVCMHVLSYNLDEKPYTYNMHTDRVAFVLCVCVWLVCVRPKKKNAKTTARTNVHERDSRSFTALTRVRVPLCHWERYMALLKARMKIASPRDNSCHTY